MDKCTPSVYIKNEKTLLYTESQRLKTIKKDEHTVHIENKSKSLNKVTLEPGIQQCVEKMSCTVRDNKIPTKKRRCNLIQQYGPNRDQAYMLAQR